MKYLYKGMAKDAPSGGGRGTPQSVTPQATGFSQIGGRSFGQAQEGGAQAMSVLLSWHEKVSVPREKGVVDEGVLTTGLLAH